jgi:hypothetical protein
VIENAHYVAPRAAGYSIMMKQESLSEFEFPIGSAWRNA